jgi:diguanylate cyclase (GGDEF)-like protein
MEVRLFIGKGDRAKRAKNGVDSNTQCPHGRQRPGWLVPGQVMNVHPSDHRVLPREDAFRRDGLALRTLPFLLVAVVAQASLALSPGPASITDALISAALLAATAMCFFLPWRSLPTWCDLAVPLLYSGSVLALILAVGGSSTGIGLVVLLPLVWTALYLQPWKSVVVVAALTALQIVTTYVPVDIADTVRVRKVLFFIIIGGLLAYSISELRIRITRSNEATEVANRNLSSNLNQVMLLSELADMLHRCVDRSEAYEVIAHSAAKMFPSGGSVSILNSSRSLLETPAAWGNYPKDEPPFAPHDCWALRRGHIYESKTGSMYCAHLKAAESPHSLCRPLMAQGETIGVLSISLPLDSDGTPTTTPLRGSVQQLALTVAEQIAISMANFQLKETLQNLSIRDPLTNLFNRRFMEETLNRELSGTSRALEQLSIMQIDVDHFKDLNDTYGHEFGDDVLKAVGGVLLNLFRASDVPCRSGGEEFTIILPKCSWEDARSRAVELQRRISELEVQHRDTDSCPSPPTLSIGIATSPEHGLTPPTLLRAADLALYSAKHAGRNRIARAVNPSGAVGVTE